MTYIDSWVREAHDEVPGVPVHEQILGELSQVFRSARGRDTFKLITKIGIGSKDELAALFRRVKESGYNITAVLRDENLRKYIGRTGQLHLD